MTDKTGFFRAAAFLAPAAALALALSSCSPVIDDSLSRTATSSEMAAFNDVRVKVEGNLRDFEWGMNAGADALERCGVSGSDAGEVLKALYVQNGCFAVCGIADADGVILSVLPAKFDSWKGKSMTGLTGFQPGDADLAARTGKFRVVNPESPLALPVLAPVHTTHGNIEGYLFAVINMRRYLSDSVMSRIGGLDINIWIMDREGNILFDRDKNEIGRNIFKDEFYRPYPSLRALAVKMLEKDYGDGSYVFPSKGKKVLSCKTCKWTTIEFFGSKVKIIMNLEDSMK
jgi:hypothetical protein